MLLANPFRSLLRKNATLLVVLLGFVAVMPAPAQTTLYTTDFEAPTFTPSTTGLFNKDGWTVAANGRTATNQPLTAAEMQSQPVYGIDANLVPSLGQTGFIGFNAPLITLPASSIYSAYRPAPVTPLTNGSPLIRFNAIIGLTKSTTTYSGTALNDTFRISFYNNGLLNDGVSRKVLASIEFPTNTATSTSNGNVYRGDSTSTLVNTEVALTFDEAMELSVIINFQTNRWSATWGGSPLFLDEVFRNANNAGTIPLTFGMVAAQWAITPYYLPTDLNKTTPYYTHPGNNWMLFDDWTIINEPLAQMAVSKVERVSNNIKLTFPSELGYSYRVEYSTNLSTWLKTLPNSLITPTVSSLSQVFTDTSTISGKRYYRVRRALPGTSGL
jgi:hypothetical protein